MIFRALDGIGDWTFGQGIGGYLTKQNAVEANIKTRLLSWKGDCFFALDDFVDWLSRLDKGQETNLNNEIKSVILASYGVVSIDSFSGVLNRQTRAYTINCTITTFFGQGYLNNLNLTAGLSPGSVTS